MRLRQPVLFQTVLLLLFGFAGSAPIGTALAANQPTANPPPTTQPGATQPAIQPAVLATGMAAHHAVYALSLKSAHGDVVGATGNMAYEVADACDAFTTRQRLTMTVTNRDGEAVDMVSDYTTWESKDGLKLRFRMRQTTDDAVTSDIVGDASLKKLGGPGVVHYTEPKKVTTELPAGTLFPMVHTATVLAAAKSGAKLMQFPLFDGTGPDGAQDTSVIVTNWAGPKPGQYPDLAKLPGGRVHVAFFDRTAEALTPDYEVGMHYWDNGVADDLSMDFGDFVMIGHLTQFKLLPRRGC